jgi:hypothetical protein
MDEEDEPERTLEHLETLSRELEATANEIAVKAKAFGGEVGARARLAQVKMRLKIALDELDGYPYTADEITDE